MDVIYPSSETLDQHRVLGEDMACVLNGGIVPFPGLLGEGGGWEAADSGIDQ